MSKIFRLYKEGNSTFENWNSSPAFPYNSTNRDSIEDPDGASAHHEITSIPSPFARIDLVKNAFKEVCKQNKQSRKVNLDGKTIFHKMVSDTLDIAEIFFNIDKYAGKIEVLKWDPSVMLAELNNSDIPGHKYLADVISKYLQSDAKTYNFGQLRNIYLLNYIEGPDEINIIGATSPATLFFSNANDLSYVDDIFFGNDKPFDSEYQPLYKRDFDFVKYFFALRKNIPNFAGLFPELDTYLIETLKQLPEQQQKNEIRNISANTINDYSPISVVNNHQNDIVEVLGYGICKRIHKSVASSSDFVIQTQKNIDTLPLVLPIESGNKYCDLQYTIDKWGNSNKAPFFDSESDLSKRVLPFDGSIMPYLTISDFLEDSIIKVPHTLNKSNYFDGLIKIDKPELAFLLPLKPLFFEYFSVKELMGTMIDGSPMLEMKLLAGESVSVTLRVPICGNGKISYIEYNRLYYSNNSADIENNAGSVLQMKFTGFIMPLVRFNKDQDAIYNISCVHDSSSKIGFDFYSEVGKIKPKSVTCRCQAQQNLIKADNYLICGQKFDYIQVQNNTGNQGMLIPIFKQQQSIETFEFAIDLGTSNTHIEYRSEKLPPQPFSFGYHDRQLCEMFIPSRDDENNTTDLINETEIIEKDYIPEKIGEGDFYFPTRTVLSCAQSIDWDKEVAPFTLVNLPFTYDKRTNLTYNNIKYNIKWGRGDELRVMEAYVRCLMLIIRNKVLLNNGDLSRTKITWFYPISMEPKRLRRLKESWNDAYNEYFGEGSTNNMTESYAPIQYYFNRYSTVTNIVNIDIGGGTTDIAFAKNKAIGYVTSFRFASNALFEDSFSDLDNSNGVIDYYKNSVLEVLKDKKLSDLIRVFNGPNNNRPSNMASFLFGLKDNTMLKRAGVNDRAIDFNYILQEDENFKIVFIIFYTSIIYHIAQITKNLGLEMPRHISFSGNGSKVIKVVTTDSKILAKYTKVIFEQVLGRTYDKELDIIGLDGDSNPKESTCKGGLIGHTEDDNQGDTIIFKSDCSGIIQSEDTYASITDAYKDRTVKAVEDFLDFVFNVNSKFDFNRNFGVTRESIELAKTEAKKDLRTYLEKGLSQRSDEVYVNDKIEETFFFYPIKGVLQSISNEIFKSLQNK